MTKPGTANPAELRALIAQKVRLDDAETDWVCGVLETQDPLCFEIAIGGTEDQVEDLLREASRWVKFGRAFPSSKDTSPSFVDLASRFAGAGRPLDARDANLPLNALNAHEHARSEVMTYIHAHYASTRSQVRDFRRRALAGRLLLPGDALTFITSHANAAFTFDELAAAGVNPLDHQTTDPVIELVASGMRVSVQIVGHPDLLVSEFVGYQGPNDLRLLAFVDQQGEVQTVPVWPQSVLDHLRATAHGLATSFRWSEAASVTFVLTGVPPWSWPLEVGVAETGHLGWSRPFIRLEVEPWVSAETVQRVYQAAQRQLHGHAPRHLSERRLALMRFVHLERSKRGGRRLTFRELARCWNHHADNMKRQDWQYKDERLDDISRDIRQTERALMHPDYPGLPSEPEPTPQP